MKKIGLIGLVIFCMMTLVTAQDNAKHVLQVVAESAFIRATPNEASIPTGSVYANTSLNAIGRNMDGEWIEVRRTGIQKTGGWIARKLTAFTFSVAELPITDSTTGLLGTVPVVDSGYAALMINEGTLRSTATRYGTQIVIVPINTTIPVLERTPDNQWLKINYKGYVGWMAEYATRMTVDINTIPVSPEYAGNSDYAAFEFITPEVQVAQIERLVDYLTPISEVTGGVVDYWRLMSRGETMECLPPAGNYAHYSVSARDLVELPELRRQTRLLKQAIADINTSINVMQRCGVYPPADIQSAYAKALNAQNVFDLILARMRILREKLTA